MNKAIMDALKTLGVPVSRHKYSGSATTYITFFEYLQQGEQYADDVEQMTGRYVQVDVWSKGDYLTLVGQVKASLTAAGFRRTTEADMYEPDTGIYHHALRFHYTE